MKTISHFLAPETSGASTISGRCCVCGWESQCFLKSDILNKATGSVSMLCPLPTEIICAYCAALWAEPKVYARSIWAINNDVQFPTISPDPEGKRPTWRDVIRHADMTAERVAILSTDPKKRVWPYAQVSQGETLSLYLHDPSRGISGNRSLSFYTLRSHLNWIEDKMTAYGFSKTALASSLLQDLKTVKAIGIEHCIALDETAQAMRQTPEWLPALIIAQKEETA